ncbi:GNAT family N-acetyltransferase [Streptomyces sp. NPDC058326]|uniref:GNAT family N-acetyltransferase n=1 Tax=Streptomyces sp. NPDC058326 TaxID=3346447 RepID=UPI0036F00840
MTASLPTAPLPTASVRTARLDLVPLAVAHAEEMAGVLADPALHTFTGGAPLPVSRLRARYERLVAGSPDPATVWANWVVRLRAEDRLTGTVQATVTGGGRVAEVAWVIGTDWQGRGIAREAAEGLVGLLREHGVRTLVAHVHPDHAASAAVARAAGLTPTDIVEDGEIRWERRRDAEVVDGDAVSVPGPPGEARGPRTHP